jgi:hypothetical protein
LPANLLQAQRDYFGAHTYQRVDKPLDQKFHSEWLLYPTSHHVLLPCQLVWQEAEVGKLDTSRNLRNLPILTCARRFKRRAQVKSVDWEGFGV